MERNKEKPAGPGMGGSPPGRGLGLIDKPKDFKNTFRRLLGYLGIYKLGILFVFLVTIVSTLFAVVSPTIAGYITTSIGQTVLERIGGNTTAAIDYPYIFKITLWLVGIYLLSFLFSYVQQYVMAGITQKLVYAMRNEVDLKLMRLPLNYYDQNMTGDILSRVTNDIDNISNTMQQSVTQLISSLITVIGIVIMMVLINPMLTLVTFITIPVSVLVTAMIAKQSQKYFKRQSKTLGALNGHVEEMYASHVVVKAFGLERESMDQFGEINEKLFQSAKMAQFVSGLTMPIMNFINNMGYIAVSVIGGFYVITGQIQIGQMQAFIQYSRNFTMPIVQVAEIINVIQSAIASAERVFQVLDEKEEINDVSVSLDSRNVRGSVEFDHVDFGYSEDKLLIEDMNLAIQPGQKVAIVGPTGAGKTTLINLMMRFYELKGGVIRVDGVDITKLDRGNLRRMFGMVLQDTWLFHGTIRENIAYGKENATEEEVIAAAQAAQADFFISSLPEGYDTVLDEEASNISQGQKQLLTIARAFLANQQILILDEATSNVDTRTELLIQKAMKKLMKGKTAFVIAHRLSTIINADLILVMNEGKVIETGTHTTLMAMKGFYSDLYNSQFQEV